MKKLIFALPLLAFVMLPAPAEAHKKTCTKEVYKEEYIPGKKNKPGRIESKWITKEIPVRVTIIMGMVMGMVGNTFTSTHIVMAPFTHMVIGMVVVIGIMVKNTGMDIMESISSLTDKYEIFENSSSLSWGQVTCSHQIKSIHS